MKIGDRVESELKRLESRAGTLTPESVIEAARNDKSALHGYFDWDDTIAAHKWRIEQARTLIRSVKIEVSVEARQIRTVAYVRDPNCQPEESQYVALAKTNTESACDVLSAEIRALIGDTRRAIGIAEASADKLPIGVSARLKTIRSHLEKLAEVLKERIAA